MRRARTLTAGRKANATTHRLKRRRTNGKTRHIPCRESSVAGSPRLPVNTPNRKALACRRDSACCNFCLSATRYGGAERLLLVVYRTRPRLGYRLLALPVSYAARFVRVSQVSAFVAGRDRRPSPSRCLRLRARWGSFAIVILRAPGGCTAADAAREGAYDRCLGLMSAWSF